MTTPGTGATSPNDGQSQPSEPLMTTASSIEEPAQGSHWHSSEHFRVWATSVAKSARSSHSHPLESLVNTTSSVPDFPNGNHAHPSELFMAVARSLTASSRGSHSHPSETIVPTSSPVAASSHEAHTNQYAEDFTTRRMFPMYPTEQDAVEYETYWEESSSPPQMPQEESPLEALDRALDTLDRRAQLLTPISEGESLEDARGQRKENRLQFPQIRNWLNGMGPQPDKAPADSAVLTPGPGTSPVIHEQQHVMSQRGSPSPDTSGHNNSSHESHHSAKPPSKANTWATPAEPQRGPSNQMDLMTPNPEILTSSSFGSQRQRSLKADALTSSSYSIVTTPSVSHQHRTLQVDEISRTPASQHSHSIGREVMEDVPDGERQHSIWAGSEVPAAIDSPMPVRSISPGKMFELLTIDDPENYLIASPEDPNLSLEGIPAPLEDFRRPSEPTRAPSGRIEMFTNEVEMPADDNSVPFEDVTMPSDREPAHSFEVLSDGDVEFAHFFRVSSDGKPPASIKIPSDRESLRSFEVLSNGDIESAHPFRESPDANYTASSKIPDSVRSLRGSPDREPASSVTMPSEELVLPLDRKSARTFSSDGIISADQGSDRHGTAKPEKSVPAEIRAPGYISNTDQQMSKDVIPVREEIAPATPASAPEPQSEEPSAELASGRDLPTRPQVLTSDVPVQERTISSETPASASKSSQSRDHSLSREYHLPSPQLKGAKSRGIGMIERLPTPELTRHLGDEVQEPLQDGPVPKPKGWAQRAASPVFTLIRQYSFRAGKRASARSTEDSTMGDDRPASPAPSRLGRENTLSADHGLKPAVVGDGEGQGGQPKSGAVKLLLSLSEGQGTPVREVQDSQPVTDSGDVGNPVDL